MRTHLAALIAAGDGLSRELASLTRDLADASHTDQARTLWREVRDIALDALTRPPTHHGDRPHG